MRHSRAYLNITRSWRRVLPRVAPLAGPSARCGSSRSRGIPASPVAREGLRIGSRLRQPPAVVLAILAGFTWCMWAGQPHAKPSVNFPPAPRQLGLWSGTPVQVEQRAREILETDDVTLMEYRLGQDSPVWLAQVAGLGNRAAFHPPELCYVGSHFEVLERAPIRVLANGRERPVMRLVLSQGHERFEAWYWFTANGRVTPSYYQQQTWLLADAIRQRPMSGTLVRISTPLDTPTSAHRRLLAFVSAWDTGHGGRTSHGS